MVAVFVLDELKKGGVGSTEKTRGLIRSGLRTSLHQVHLR